MYQNRFRLGLRPRPHWGSLQHSPRPLAVFKGPTSKGKEGEGEERRERGGEWKGKGRRGEGEGGEGGGERLYTPPVADSWLRHWLSALYAIANPSVCPSVRLSVRLSVTRVDQSKTVKVRIMQFSHSSSTPLVSSR